MNTNYYLSKLQLKMAKLSLSETDISKINNLSERLISRGFPVILCAEHLAKLIGINVKDLVAMVFDEKKFYHQFEIPKRNGKYRKILAPSKDLKYIQRWILDNILIKIPISIYANGFCNSRSILTNAKYHTNSYCVINVDIQDFFPSIDFKRIFRLFYYIGYSKNVSFILAKLCIHDDKLPQGSPASPYLSNLVCKKLDKRLSQLAQSLSASYTRYADDITISGNKNLSSILPLIKHIICSEGFELNDSKTRIRYKNQKQEVTGLIVNNSEVKVDKNYKRKIHQEIYYCKKYGVTSHLDRIECNKAFYKEHLYGKAYFIHMVEPNEGKKIFEMLDSITWYY